MDECKGACIFCLQDMVVDRTLVGHRVQGTVVSTQPQLLEKDSQLVLLIMDKHKTLAQV
jgi:hypothetical protein